ncbi:TonB-dependent receptor [Alteromonas sp. ASW11-130]|uniref:TonB-dependent receptor n=1 Tax=Alteromonas sp. ASW11-130 TaxID=3015775 RepID=UPI0022421540|nr:TonB-dependent receptor [Alteromonas sp. ASW11-130]MCW8090256.1 TonB-dependent receptor [Alteromonas sp. ASW11-130]
MDYPNTLQKTLLATSITLCFSSTLLAQDEDGPLERIEVTSQKRVQNLQEVPVAVTALSGDDLLDSVSFDVFDLQSYVPAFAAFQSQSATNSGFSIRSIGTSTQNFGFEPSVGLYVDGVYRSRQNSIVNDLADIQRIEILRGPQGTLFGKNTPAGAVSIYTKSPTFENGDGYVAATIGNDDLISIQGGSSFVAIENELAFRAAGFTTHRDGWINDSTSGEKINDRNRAGVRLQALYTPQDDLTIRLIADYAEIDEVCCGALTFQGNQNALGIKNKNGTDAAFASPPFNATIYDKEDFYNYTTAISFLPESSMEDQGISAHISYTLNENWHLESISAVRSFNSFDKVDADFSDTEILLTKNDADLHAFSQELRLHYTTHAFNGLLGAYYYSQNLNLDYAIATQDDFPFLFSSFAAQVMPLVAGLNAISQLTQGTIQPAAIPAPANTHFVHNAYQEQDSYAVFAQSDWRFSSQWELTTGLRYTEEDKSLNAIYDEQGPGIDGLSFAPDDIPNPLLAGAALQNIGAALGTGVMPTAEDLAAIAPFQQAGWGYYLLNTAIVLPRPPLSESFTDSQVTGTVKLSWLRTDDQLLYSSLSTGYKSGGINTDRISALLNPVFNAEKSRSVEVGLKQDWNDVNLRLNLAAHITAIKDFQSSTFTGTGFNLSNAGDFDSKGVEVELTWNPLDDTTLTFNLTYNKATFDFFEKGTCWTATPWHYGIDDPGRTSPELPYCSRSGDRVGFEPETSFTIMLSQHAQLFDLAMLFSIDYAYVGSLLMDHSNDPLKENDAYNLVNLRWQLPVNVWDSEVTFWARNVFDEEYVARNAFDAPFQRGKVMAYPGQPRSYGVTWTTHF